MGSGEKRWDDLSVLPLGPSGVVLAEPPAVANAEPEEVEPEPEPEPEGEVLYFEDFDGYADGSDPVAWLDTGARNGLGSEPSLFENVALADGNMAFGTLSEETNIHSHLTELGADSWSSYELSGRMLIAEPDGGVGVTVYSEYPSADRYYRLRRYGSGSFVFSHHGTSPGGCAADTGVIPSAGTWYWFRVRAVPEDGATRLRAKVWAAHESEPGWQASCLEASGSSAGRPGLWSMGPGAKLWDDLEVYWID